MNNKTINVMLALCLILLIVLVIEWQVAGLVENNVEDMNTAEQEYQDDEKQLSAIALIKSPLTSYTEMVDRPLFIQGRRSVSTVLDVSINQEGSKIEDMTLVGIYSVENQLVAAFSKQGVVKKFVKISAKDDIAGWNVKEVQQDKVILQKGSKQQILLLRAPKEKMPTKPAAIKKALARKRRKTNIRETK